MVISRSDPASSRRCDYMATAAKPPPPHASSSHSSPQPSSAAATTSTTTTTKRQALQSHQQQQQQQRGIAYNHHQSSLHDFSFPVLKTWGRQRLLRCAKVPPDRNERTGFVGGGCASGNVSSAGGGVTDRRFPTPPPAPVPPRTKVVKVKDDGLEKIPAKLMGKFHEVAGRMEFKARPVPVPAARRPDAPPTWDEEEEEDYDDDIEEEEEDEDEDDEEYPDLLARTASPAPVAVSPLPQPLAPAVPPEEVKPWKIRTRRSTYKHTRTSESRRRRRESSPCPAVSSPHHASPSAVAATASPAHPLAVPVAPPPSRSLRSRSSAPPTPEDQDPAAEQEDHQHQHQQSAVQPRRSRKQPSRQPQQLRKPFSLTLSKEEIEEDIYALTGRRASRRPKKRPRALRRQLDMLVPGYYLSEVTLSQYDVREPARES